jgi:hypothetical protein
VGLVLGGGGGGTFDALPMPLGSLTELLTPPALPGPDGMPLTPVVPAPAEPAFGVPTALPDPAAVPAPVFWANDGPGTIRMVTSASAVVERIFDIGCSPGDMDRQPLEPPAGSSPMAGFHCALNGPAPLLITGRDADARLYAQLLRAIDATVGRR